jgi:phi13 family phage major tail protein
MSPLSVNSGEYKSRIGLDSLYVAEVTADSASAYTAGTPEVFAPAAEASQEPATSFAIQYADDQPYDVMTGEGETKITISVTNIPPEMLAWITGKVFDAASGRVWDDKAEAPYFALGFRSLKANGSYRYYWFLKGKFDMPKEEMTTKGDSPEPKTLALTYTAIFTTYAFDVGAVNNNVKRVFGDEDTTNFSATGWFSQVQTPVVTAPSALALSSSVPTDGATGVSVSANQTLTFNNALINDAIYEVVMAKADGTVVTMASGYPQLDATKKIMTLDPASSLSASTVYLISYAVTDIYGQHLAGVVNFTTA